MPPRDMNSQPMAVLLDERLLAQIDGKAGLANDERAEALRRGKDRDVAEVVAIAEVVLAALAAAEHDLAARTYAGNRDLDVNLVTVERDLARDRRPCEVAAQIVLVGFEAEMARRHPERRTRLAVEGALSFGIVTDAAAGQRDERGFRFQLINLGEALAAQRQVFG